MDSPYIDPTPPGYGSHATSRPGPFFLELQLDAHKLGQLIANRLRIEPICVPEKLANPVPGAGAFVVDHIDLPEGARFEHDGQHLRLVIQLRVHLFQYEPDLRLPITFDTFFRLKADGPNLCVVFTGTDLPHEFAMYGDFIRDALEGVDLCGAIDLTPLLSFVGSATVSKAHIEATGSINVIALRLLVGEETSAWSAFEKSPIVVSIAGNEDWALRVDTNLLAYSATRQLIDGLASHAVIVTQAPDVSWTPFPTSIVLREGTPIQPPVTKLVLGALSVDAEAEWGSECHIGFDASVTTGFEVRHRNRVSLTTRIDWSPNFWDAFLCLGPIGGPLGDIFAAVYAPDLPTPSHCDRTSDHIIECDYPVELPPLDFGGPSPLAEFALTSYRPALTDLVFAGTLTLLPIVRPKLSLLRSPFAWAVLGSCNHFVIGAQASVVIQSVPPLTTTSCHIEVLDDPLGVFEPRMVVDPHGHRLPRTVTFTFDLSAMPPDHSYWSAPYPLHLLVQTTAGADVVRLGVLPPEPEGEQLLGLQTRAASLQANCTKAAHGLFGPSGRLDLPWLIDPAPDEVTIWNGVVTHATPGSTFELADDAGAVLASSPVAIDGTARLTTHLTGAASRPVHIRRRSERGDGSTAADLVNAKQAALHQRHLRLVPRSAVRLGARCLSARVERAGRQLVLTAVTTRGIEFHDISAPDRPRVLSRAGANGSDGAMSWRGGLLYWGNEGVSAPATSARIEARVAAAERIGDFLVLLTAEGISVCDDRLHRIGGLELEHTGHMIRAGHCVAIGTDSGLTLVDIQVRKHPVIVGLLELPPLTRLLGGGLVGGTMTLVAVHERAASVVQAAPHPRVVAHYASVPWTAGIQVAGSIWARVTDDASAVALYTLGKTIESGITAASSER